MKESLAANFFIVGKASTFAYRRMYSCPRVGDLCVFSEKRYTVKRVEWCLDDDATAIGTRVNIELAAIAIKEKTK